MDYKSKLVGGATALFSVGALSDINWTEYEYVLGQLIGLVGAVLEDLPSIIIIIALVIGIMAVAMFIPGLLKKILDMIKF